MKITKGNIPEEMQMKKASLQSQLVSEASEQEVKIELLIREKYSLSQELKLHREKLMGKYSSEWDEYCAYIEECIRKVEEETDEI